MRSKYILYTGITILTAGILVRYLTPYELAGLGMIISGVLLKLVYIVIAIIKGIYKPGREILLLIIGLALLFLGLWHKLNVSTILGQSMIAFAVLLKLIFIILFIRKTKKGTQQVNE